MNTHDHFATTLRATNYIAQMQLSSIQNVAFATPKPNASASLSLDLAVCSHWLVAMSSLTRSPLPSAGSADMLQHASLFGSF